MNKKNIVALGIVLILAVVAAGGFFIWESNQTVEVVEEQTQGRNQQQGEDQQTEVDMRDWKTYRNEEYGFEVKYPEGWEIGLVENGYMKVRSEISECALIPEGCPIIVLYDKDDYFNSDYVSVHIVKDSSNDVDKIVNQKRQWWSEGELYGCNVSANKILNGNNFSFRSFYVATDVNDKRIKVDAIACENSDLNPFFDEIVKSFVSIN